MQSIEEIIDTKEYRGSIGTVDHSGKRVWIYPKKLKGGFHNKRLILAAVLLTIFFATRWSGYALQTNEEKILNLWLGTAEVYGQATS
ncbi:MAG: hypothetical protein OHK0038_28330 [Flammeovirgaceae bacterium]